MSNQERGFGAMDPDKQREIASKGGQAAHEQGTAHEFTSEEAREAGRKGGEASGGGNRQGGQGGLTRLGEGGVRAGATPARGRRESPRLERGHHSG